MYLSMDMGTSSTRLWLCDGEKIIAHTCRRFGAGYRKQSGSEAFFDKVNSIIDDLLSGVSLERQDIEGMIISGMGTSEIGICDIPHIQLPIDEYTLAQNVVERIIPEINNLKLFFVPGVKQARNGEIEDIMRGEETEICGIMDSIGEIKRCAVVLPGTHNKVIKINESGQIECFMTAMSGEIIDLVIKNSILSGSVSHDFAPLREYVILGAEDAANVGLTNTLFKIRVMSKNGVDVDSLSSYLYGAVLSQDVPAILRITGDVKIYIGGNENFRKVLAILLRHNNAIELSEEISSSATRCGLSRIYSIYRSLSKREDVIASIEREKLIAIVRNPDLDTLFDAVDALYEGGVRILEVTFDRSGKIPHEKTADIIASLSIRYKGKMHIGAGTVTSAQEVDLARCSGAEFIISPNADAGVISHTRKNGLVSIPGAYTPTEITTAADAGADFIKLFPADDVSFKYVKALKAPLSDVKLLAVGGVNHENARSFIENGFCGIGIGSNLYDKELISQGRFSELSDRARKYVNALK